MLLFDFNWNGACRFPNHTESEADGKNGPSIVSKLFWRHPLDELLGLIDSLENICDPRSPISSGH